MNWKKIVDKNFINYLRVVFNIDDTVIVIHDSHGDSYINILLKYPNENTYHFKHITLKKYQRYLRTEKLKKLNNYV